MYERSKGVPLDYAAALSWYRKAADRGSHIGQNHLGKMYEEGNGVQQDYVIAMSWYRKAAERGNAHAQNNLGDMYREGTGVPQDYQTAYSWYRKAADGGDDRAQRLLGLMYEEGKGVSQDAVIALQWFNLAAGKGSELEAEIRDSLAQKMTPAQIVEAQRLAMNWYRRAADQGNSDAQFNLALLYDRSRRPPKLRDGGELVFSGGQQRQFSRAAASGRNVCQGSGGPTKLCHSSLVAKPGGRKRRRGRRRISGRAGRENDCGTNNRGAEVRP